MNLRLPFQYSLIFRKFIADYKTILDIGCGEGYLISQINWDKKYQVVGVDIFSAYINKAKKTGYYYKIFKQDIRHINFPPKSFDVVICSQVIEHLRKKDSEKLISALEKIAINLVIIGTPNGKFMQKFYDQNKFQKHLSTWNIMDFVKRGYRVYGQGLKLVYGQRGWLSMISKDIFF